jgi:aspartyl-tRNA(Asn)/glutamyl-tRNA(Gln) amidotransferase subunit C
MYVKEESMKITPEEVVYVANLAHLDLKPDEVERMTRQLDTILSYVDKLNELETDNVVPTTHAISIHNAFRPDEAKKSLSREEALANGPVQNGEAFVVAKVI